MAIFNKAEEMDTADTQSARKVTPTRPVRSNNVSVIGPTLVFKGELTADEDLIIEGQIEGTIAHHNKHLTIGELAERPLPWLIMRFGIRGEWFHRLANGIDERLVEVSRETKSISAEVTFAEDVSDREELRAAVKEQATRVGRQLRKASIRARTVQIKLRLADFTTFTRQRTLPVATDAASMIETAALELLEIEVGGGRQFRLIGTGVSNLMQSETTAQLSLFDRPGGPDPTTGPAIEESGTDGTGAKADGNGPTVPQRAALSQTVRDLQKRFGDDAVDWGATSDGEWTAGWDREWTDGWETKTESVERDGEPV